MDGFGVNLGAGLMRGTAWILAWVMLVACGPGRRTGDGTGGNGGAEAASGQVTATSVTSAGAATTAEPGGSGEASGSSDEDGIPDPNADCQDGWTECNGVECQEGWVVCNGECVTLGSNRAHCGACYRGCEGYATSNRCALGKCQPALWPCILKDDNWPSGPPATCADACASAGRTCSTDAVCAGAAIGWMTDGVNDNYIEDDIEACRKLTGGNLTEQLACNDPLPWDFELLGTTIVGFACCCTQD